MTPTELIDLLVEAQMLVEESAGVFGWKPTMKKTETFARLVAAKEREACAKVCDSFQARDVGMQPAECAGAIRARGEQAMNAFDYKGQPSIWRRDEKLKRFKQGDEFAKKRQDKGDINDKNQVFTYSKALSKK